MEFSHRSWIQGYSEFGTSTLVSERLTGAPFVADELPGEDPNSNNRSFSDPKLESLERRIDRRFSAFQGQIWISDIQISEIQAQIWMAICNGEEIGAANLKLQSSPPSYSDRRSSPTFLTADEETKGDNLALRSFRLALFVIKQIEADDLPLRSEIGDLQIWLDDLDALDPFLTTITTDPCHSPSVEEPNASTIGASDMSSVADEKFRSSSSNYSRSRLAGTIDATDQKLQFPPPFSGDRQASSLISGDTTPLTTGVHQASSLMFGGFASSTTRVRQASSLMFGDFDVEEIAVVEEINAEVAAIVGSVEWLPQSSSSTVGVRQSPSLMVGGFTSMTAGDHQATSLLFGDFDVVEEIDADVVSMETAAEEEIQDDIDIAH